MLFMWILPTSLLAGFVAQSHLQSPKALAPAAAVQLTAKFVPDPNVPPRITQGSGTR
jgi:hypothetical protein